MTIVWVFLVGAWAGLIYQSVRAYRRESNRVNRILEDFDREMAERIGDE